MIPIADLELARCMAVHLQHPVNESELVASLRLPYMHAVVLSQQAVDDTLETYSAQEGTGGGFPSKDKFLVQTVRYPAAGPTPAVTGPATPGSTHGGLGAGKTDMSRSLAALWSSAKWKKQIVPLKLKVRFFRGTDVSDDSESDSGGDEGIGENGMRRAEMQAQLVAADTMLPEGRPMQVQVQMSGSVGDDQQHLPHRSSLHSHKHVCGSADFDHQ